MLSLKDNIHKLDRDDERFLALFACFVSTLDGIRDFAITTTAECTEKFRSTVEAIKTELSASPKTDVLKAGNAALLSALEEYQLEAAVVQSKKDDDLRMLFGVLADTAQTLSSHNDRHSWRLQQFTQQIQIIARGSDLSLMRRDLTKHVAEMKAAQDAMWQDNNSSIGPMREQLTQFQKRLEVAELRASTDALTGLLTRGEGEDQLNKRLLGSDPVSVMLIDLDNFKQINDRWGHNAGDQVLKDFSRMLSRSVRPSDVVSRWGGDEFLIISACDQEVAQKRAVELRDSLRFQHKLVVLGKIIEVPISASIGVTEIIAGETPNDLLARADESMYKHKRNRRVPRGGVPVSK